MDEMSNGYGGTTKSLHETILQHHHPTSRL
jgi:hypothetical protein